MIIPRIRLCFTLLVVTVIFNSCKNPFVTVVPVPGENVMVITKIPSGCHISVESDPTIKTPLVHVSTPEELVFEAVGQDFQTSFPHGSPLAGPDPLILSGTTKSYPISFFAKLRAEADLVLHGKPSSYDLDIYDAHDPQKLPCDPIVHVTR